uniref:Uncharacterized protein n=1 Tax=Anguilla anguilla TaxID=7936 RepID=A0A0E9RAF2_ANGAN
MMYMCPCMNTTIVLISQFSLLEWVHLFV